MLRRQRVAETVDMPREPWWCSQDPLMTEAFPECDEA